MPQMPMLMPRQNREAGEEIVPHAGVERRRDAHLRKRQAVRLGETVELRRLQTIEFLDQELRRGQARRQEPYNGLDTEANRRAHGRPPQPTDGIPSVPTRLATVQP